MTGVVSADLASREVFHRVRPGAYATFADGDLCIGRVLGGRT